MHIPAATNDHCIWLRVGTLLDGACTAPIRNAHLVYDKNQILFTGQDSPPKNLLRDGQSEPDADLFDYTLLPSLIEAHAHLFLEGGELDSQRRAAYLKQTPASLLEQARVRLEKLVRLGIAGVRDAGDKDGVGLGLNKLYASDHRPLMPYVDSPGAAIHRRGRYGTFMALPLEDFASPRDCVAALVREGASRIKLIASGIIDFKKGTVTGEPQMTADEIREFVAAAASFGRQTFAHATGDAGIQSVIEGGVDSVEHGFFVRDDQLSKMRDRQIAWVPTFAPVQKQLDHAERIGWDASAIANLRRILDQHAASLRKAQAMGVLIIAGSDAGSYGVAHGAGFLYELELMERAGLSPLAVIIAATGAASNRLAFRERFGQIKPGFLPRFILTRHSPLQSVAHLRQPRTIVFGDRSFETGEHFDAAGL